MKARINNLGINPLVIDCQGAIMTMRPTISYKPQGFSLVPKKGVIARLPLKMPLWCLKLWDARRRLLPSCVYMGVAASNVYERRVPPQPRHFKQGADKISAYHLALLAWLYDVRLLSEFGQHLR